MESDFYGIDFLPLQQKIWPLLYEPYFINWALCVHETLSEIKTGH